MYRIREQSRQQPDLQEALDATSGIWRRGDGLDYQNRLRSEWSRET